MKSFFHEHCWLIVILIAAFLVRIVGIGYGLPYHLYGDEETNVYSALKMIQLKTFLPVLHPSDFTPLLYEPPVLAYLYTIVFVPTIAVLYVFSHVHSLAHFQSSLIVDPSALWLVGRTINVLFSVVGVYLVYAIAARAFKSRAVGLWSGFFLAFSFLDATISATTRHWTLGTFFSSLSLLLVLRAYDAGRSQKSQYWQLALGGLALGLSFGTSYLVYFFPFIALLIAYYALRQSPSQIVWSRLSFWRTYIPAVIYVGCFTVVSILMIAVHPYPLYVQAIHHVVPDAIKSPLTFIRFYASTLWNFDLPLTLFSLFGAFYLAMRERKLFMLILLSLVLTAIPMYRFLPNIARYIGPLLPLFVILAGYGANEIRTRLASHNILIAVLGIIVCIYLGAVFGRNTVLLLQNDSRVAAKTWIESHIPTGSVVVLASDTLRLQGTTESLKREQALSPTSLRAADTVLLADASYATHPYNLYSLFDTTPEIKNSIVYAAVMSTSSEKYLVTDSWTSNDPYIRSVLPTATRIAQFPANGEKPELTSLFIAGNYDASGIPLLRLLYESPTYGPLVTVYKLK